MAERPGEHPRMHYPGIACHDIEAAGLDPGFVLSVMMPAVADGSSERFPVVYMTDANAYFEACCGIARSLQLSPADAPRFILVGIGYPGSAPCAGALLRARDLTFPGYPKLNLAPPPYEGVLRNRKGAGFGGGEAFQDVFQDMILPFVDSRYPTEIGSRVYFGHSAGGGFGLFTLATRPRLFSGYIISSPGLCFHGVSSAGVAYDHYDFLPERLGAFVVGNPDLRDLRLYVSAGTEEDNEPGLECWRITSQVEQLATLLEAAADLGLEATLELLAGETHATAWPIAFMHGVQAMFGTGPSRGQRWGRADA